MRSKRIRGLARDEELRYTLAGGKKARQAITNLDEGVGTRSGALSFCHGMLD